MATEQERRTCIDLIMSSPYRHSSPEQSLDELFVQLQEAPTPSDAEAIAEAIWERWLHHEDLEIVSLMSIGREALEQEEFEEARKAFGEAIRRDPEYAEAWNKRAIVKYLTGEYAGSRRDMLRTLELEPRHFGALSGLGAIYLIVMAREKALQVFERLLELYPLAPNVQKQVRVLRDTLGDNG